jgi:hypothetical protein
MTQISDEQLEAASERAVAKLQAAYDGLSDDERLALDFAARRLVAGEQADAQGYMIKQPTEQPVIWPDPAEGKPLPWVFFPTTRR